MKKNMLLGTIVLSLILLSACSSQNAAQSSSAPKESASKATADVKPIILKAVTAWEQNNIASIGYVMFKKKLEEQGKGRIKIEYTGGPESIPAFNQGDAVRNGVVDFADISASYFTGQIPEAAALLYSELSPEQEIANGAMDALNKISNQKMNAQIVARNPGVKFSIYLKKPVASIKELSGLRIRTTPGYLPFLKALGAQPVTMPAGEVYNALERGIVDGLCWPNSGITDLGWEKQIKYQIEPSFYQNDAIILMNLNKWNSLPQDVKDLINKVSREIEKELPAANDEYKAKEKEKLNAAGLKTIQLPDKELIKIASDSAWAWYETNNPSNGKQLSQMFRAH